MRIARPSPLVFLSVLAGLMLMTSSAAQAQKINPFPVRVKIGLFQPKDQYTRKVSGSTHFSTEIDVALPLLRSRSTQTLFSVGYSYKSGNGYGLRSSYGMVPLSLTLVRSFSRSEDNALEGFYYGAGIGLYLVRATGISLVGRTSPPNFSSGDRSRVLSGTSFVAGYQMTSGFLFEAKYHAVAGNVQGYNADGLSVFLGKRL